MRRGWSNVQDHGIMLNCLADFCKSFIFMCEKKYMSRIIEKLLPFDVCTIIHEFLPCKPVELCYICGMCLVAFDKRGRLHVATDHLYRVCMYVFRVLWAILSLIMFISSLLTIFFKFIYRGFALTFKNNLLWYFLHSPSTPRRNAWHRLHRESGAWWIVLRKHVPRHAILTPVYVAMLCTTVRCMYACMHSRTLCASGLKTCVSLRNRIWVRWYQYRRVRCVESWCDTGMGQ